MTNQNRIHHVPAGSGPGYRGPGDQIRFDLTWPKPLPNHRVLGQTIGVAVDADDHKRHWGAYGKKPDDADVGPYRPGAPPAAQFRNPVDCAMLSEDNLLYVGQSLEVLTSFGEGGRQPGEFYGVHSIATDSKGNIYTTETWRSQRVQRFPYKGLAPVTTRDQGVLRPKSQAQHD